MALENNRAGDLAHKAYLHTAAEGENGYTPMPAANVPHAIVSRSPLDPALDQASLAMSLRTCGLLSGDARLFPKARLEYTNALRALQFNLKSPETMMKDETLAAACIMALYEVSVARSDNPVSAVTNGRQLTDPEQTDPDAWLRHIEGIATLLQARVPHRHKEQLSRSSFEKCRSHLVSHRRFERAGSG